MNRKTVFEYARMGAEAERRLLELLDPKERPKEQEVQPDLAAAEEDEVEA